MKLVIIFGPQAVGKMTVGQELEKRTGLKLFHNHMTIEMVNPFFGYGTDEGKRLVELFREEIFKAMAKSDQKGLIFTYIWDFDDQGDWEYVKHVAGIFEAQGGDVYFVELESHIDERIKRNTSENRLKHKPSKQNVKWSENELRQSVDKYRLNSREGEVPFKNYVRIDNTEMTPEEVAERVKGEFDL
jgi:cytidylate kinase